MNISNSLHVPVIAPDTRLYQSGLKLWLVVLQVEMWV